MNDEMPPRPPPDATDARQPTIFDALAELARGIASGGRRVERDPGSGARAKVTRASRRSCCSGKR
jgi:hypothetical protein